MMKECLAHEVEQRPTANEIDTRLQRLGNNTLKFGENSDTDEEEANVSLFDIFPKHIAEALKDGRRIEPEFKSCVSIFFSDVVGFTDISSKLQPQKVARLLDRLYKVFDDLADKVCITIAWFLCHSVKAIESHCNESQFKNWQHEVFKVETIGDCYVAVVGLPKPRKDHGTLAAIRKREAWR